MVIVSGTYDDHPLVTLKLCHQVYLQVLGLYTDINLSPPLVSVVDQRTHADQLITPLLVVGVDGASSRVRAAVARHPNFNF